MPEWSNGAVSKTVERYAFQGFESLSLRVSIMLSNDGIIFFCLSQIFFLILHSQLK